MLIIKCNFKHYSGYYLGFNIENIYHLIQDNTEQSEEQTNLQHVQEPNKFRKCVFIRIHASFRKLKVMSRPKHFFSLCATEMNKYSNFLLNFFDH